ncbi:hypothetical protein [Microvirga puerhi]|uniref:DUF3857 domain-containing protein n=1 Tax=Microvirga puerhi TaxID=2876078 RepID=A0ABS7VPF1_9HYPH|nr:hypothetical protein [Microvirga puerhi]MBZ6077433.1 hypothetical protein [Microvirga puerhi]
MLHRLSPIALAFALSLPALADECPNAQTAKTGFVLERQGTQAEVRPTADSFVHVVNTYPGGKKQDVIYYRGLFEISRFDEDGRRFNVPLSDLRSIFPLDSKARRAVTYAPAQPNKIAAPISLEITVAGQEKLQLGSCSYDVTIVRNRAMNAEGRVLSEYTDLYAPDLGFVLGRRYEEKGGRQTTVLYQKIRPLARTSPL